MLAPAFAALCLVTACAVGFRAALRRDAALARAEETVVPSLAEEPDTMEVSFDGALEDAATEEVEPERGRSHIGGAWFAGGEYAAAASEGVPPRPDRRRRPRGSSSASRGRAGRGWPSPRPRPPRRPGRVAPGASRGRR